MLLAATLAGAAGAFAGCAPATPASPPGPTATQPPTSTPPATTAAPAGCPVDAATLQQAFQANAALARAIILGGGLVGITCYQNFAVAHTTPTNMDSALVLFSFDPTTGTWTAVAGGTAVPCGDHGVPASVVPHLPGCADQ